MECYGSSWEEYTTLIFLSEDPGGLSGQLYSVQLMWGRGGRAESLWSIVPDNVSKTTQRMGLVRHQEQMSLLSNMCPWGRTPAQKPILGCGTYTAQKGPGEPNELLIPPGKAVISDAAVLHTRGIPKGAGN